MPLRPPSLTASRPSERDRKRELDRRRGTAKERGYDADWRRLRKAKLEADPLCECDDCQAGKRKVTAADTVDHIIPVEERPDLRLVWSNLRSMNKTHHDARTARDQGFNKGKRVVARGSDQQGWPSDPQHGWNR